MGLWVSLTFETCLVCTIFWGSGYTCVTHVLHVCVTLPKVVPWVTSALFPFNLFFSFAFISASTAVFVFTACSSSATSAEKPAKRFFNGVNVNSFPVTFCVISVSLCSFHGNHTEHPEVVSSSLASGNSMQANTLLPCAPPAPLSQSLMPRNCTFIRLNPKLELTTF